MYRINQINFLFQNVNFGYKMNASQNGPLEQIGGGLVEDVKVGLISEDTFHLIPS